MTLENTNATVKWFNEEKGYGFFRVVDPESGVEQLDAFVHVSWLEQQGFSAGDMIDGTNAVIHYGTNRAGKMVALAVHSIGAKDASAPSTAVVISKAKPAAKFDKLPIVDRGESWEIRKDASRGLYILKKEDTEPTDYATLARARENAGWVDTAKAGDGVKTNDPALSQKMQGVSGGKKAA